MLGSGTLLHFWSWRSIFWAFAGFALLIFVLACTVSSSRDDESTPLDWAGAALIAGAVAVFVFGVLEAPARGWTHPLVYGSMGTGVALAVAFGFVEARLRHPLLDVRLFRRPDFATGSATITVFFMALFGFFFVIMQYIQLVRGYSPIQTAFALSPLMAPMLTLSVLSPWYLPRMGLRLVVFVGLLLISAGFLWMRVLQVDSSYWDMMWPLLVMSAGIGFCTAPSTLAIMTAVPDQKQGVASAVNDTTREVGAALGIALAGSILAARYSHVLTPHLAAFPGPVRAPASRSLASALEIAKSLGPHGRQLAELSQNAFLQAMGSALLVMGLVIAVAALMIGAWAPGRDGRQLRPLRRERASADELRGPVAEHHDAGVRSPAGDARQHRSVDHP
jgi:predicted MFS family arabinose efflux permease